MRISWWERGWGLVPSISAPARMITVRSGELAVGAADVACARLSCHVALARQRAAARATRMAMERVVQPVTTQARLPPLKIDRIFLNSPDCSDGEYSDLRTPPRQPHPWESRVRAQGGQKGTDRFANTLRPGKVQYRGVPAASFVLPARPIILCESSRLLKASLRLARLNQPELAGTG